MSSARETVIIVHGTWANSTDDLPAWYGRGDPHNFSAKLDLALEARGSSARCWAHCASKSVFTWSGDNTWIARSLASSELASYVNKLQADGWHCHIVAHSHGGNIVAEALPLFVSTLENPAGIDGAVVTLGTPFIGAMTPIEQGIEMRRNIATVTAWVFTGLLVAFLAFIGIVASIGSFDFLAPYKRTNLLYPVVMPIAFVTLLGLALALRNEFKRKGSVWRSHWLRSKNVPRPFVLSIGSAADEAWQLLHHLRTIDNPLAVRGGFLNYLSTQRRLFADRHFAILKLHGARFFRDLSWHAKVVAFTLIALTFLTLGTAVYGIFQLKKEPVSEVARTLATLLVFTMSLISIPTFLYGRSFYSAVWSPFRWLLAHALLLSLLPSMIATYIARQKGWTVLRELVLGLEGYRFPLPEVRREPPYMSPDCFKYEDLPNTGVALAVELRGDWVNRHLTDATQMFSNFVVTASDLQKLLKIIETDLSMVHAFYYTNEKCIGRIADWIVDHGRSSRDSKG